MAAPDNFVMEKEGMGKRKTGWNGGEGVGGE